MFKGELVFEDVKIGATNKPIEQKLIKGNVNRLQNYFKKLIKFLGDLFNGFMEKVSGVFKNNQEKLAENAKYLNPIPKEALKTMSLSAIPYWDKSRSCHEKLMDQTRGYYSKQYVGKKITEIYAELDKVNEDTMNKNELYQHFFKPLYDLDTENVKNAAFIYFRGGQADTVQYNGNDCQLVVKIMYNFVMESQKYINLIKAEHKNMQTELEKLDGMLDSFKEHGESVGVKTSEESYTFEGKEMYSDIEDSSLFLTEFYDKMKDEYGNSIVLEDIAPVEVQSTPDSSKPADKSTPADNKTSTTTTTTANNNQQQNNNDHEKKSAESNISKTKIAMDFARTCSTVLSVKLSVYEEVSNHYTNTCLQVASAVKKYLGVKEEEEENKNYNQQQRMNADKASEDRQADNINTRREINARKGLVPRIWGNLFGSGK